MTPTTPATTSAGRPAPAASAAPTAPSPSPAPAATPPGASAHTVVRHAPGRGTLGGVALVLAGAVTVQFGSAVAALLFPRAGALGTVALRVAFAALLLLVFVRPRVRGYGRTDWAVVLGYGLALGGMNLLFYQAVERIPLGAAVACEVLGPLLLSVAATRRPLSLLWAGLALAGVWLLGGGSAGGLDAAGVAFALGAGAMWAAYIVAGARAGARFPRLDGLALAMAVAALVALPSGIASAGAVLLEPRVLALGLAVAVLGSGVPYALELLALRRLPAATFAVLTSLAPALAALAGYLVLDQTLTLRQCTAIALIITATTGAVRTTRR
ncbi:EamA family transporter [Streptomyces sp. NPDC101118]|uniref:EamA family transporter n=1 Tax=Streptomyces sp. NPDC101118 TaxID=3366109 RepID=UPI0038234A19